VLPPRLDNPPRGPARPPTAPAHPPVPLPDRLPDRRRRPGGRPRLRGGGGAGALAQTDPDQGPDWIQLPWATTTLTSTCACRATRRARLLPGDDQVQLLDTGSTGCAVGLQAVTPAGQQYNGLDNGPTVFAPRSASSTPSTTARPARLRRQEVLVNSNDNGRPIQRSLQYGMAVQRPVVTDGPDALRNLYFYVGPWGSTVREGGPAPGVWEWCRPALEDGGKLVDVGRGGRARGAHPRRVGPVAVHLLVPVLTAGRV